MASIHSSQSEPGFTFSPDSQKVVFVVSRTGSERGTVHSIVTDGVEREIVSGTAPTVFFTPDGKHQRYVVQHSGAAHIMLDDLEQRAIASAEYHLLTTPDGTRTILIETPYAAGGLKAVLVDGKQVDTFHRLETSFRISPDGKHLSYTVRTGRILSRRRVDF